MPRVHWNDLPEPARNAIIERTGPVQKVETAQGGANSGFAARVHTASDVIFVKGMPATHSQMPTQRREAAINPYLPAASPTLLWNVQEGGWDLLAYECILARHADYTPGSPDLPLVAAALGELQAIDGPSLASVKEAPTRWATYLGGDAELLAGTTLLHTDLAPHNVLITDRAHLIDWAWPTRGAAWIDPAVLILRLMEVGHTAQDADRWAGRFRSWATAPSVAVAAFSRANMRVWAEIVSHDPLPWKQHMAEAAREWTAYWERRPQVE
ncbi:aminoglycoside phosphotransferase [Streptomyces xantholiticus]|uniref:Aminoglycoside phosphotransferase n=1 Tax=Streptomyces xantholiticus TaxID=68285 RepID=A0ABV1UZU5_9ACTN